VAVDQTALRARELEDRLEELRQAVKDAIAAHEAGETPAVIFRELRTVVDHVPAGRWNKEACISKAWAWAEKFGDPPAAINWNPAGLKQRGREHLLEAWASDDWPSLATVQRLFGSWNAFMAAAGYTPRLKNEQRGPGGAGKGLDHLPEWHGWQMLAGYRDRAGLSQHALADRAQLSIEYVGFIERGKQTNPSVRVLLALARALDVSASVLLDDAGQVATGVRS
jgi:DNA-binding XRE family transcriptional regulator